MPSPRSSVLFVALVLSALGCKRSTPAARPEAAPRTAASTPAAAPPSAAATATARLDERVMVNQGLEIEQVRTVLRANAEQVRQCYAQALATNPSLVGRVSIDFVVLPTGAVGAASIADESASTPAIDGCVTGAVRRWTFSPTQPPVVARVHASYDLGQAERSE